MPVASAPDANGLDQRSYSLADDFTLAGRPGLFTSVSNGGTAHFSAALNKTAVTTDNLRPEVAVRNGTTKAVTTTPVTVTPITSTGAVDTARVKVVTQVRRQLVRRRRDAHELRLLHDPGRRQRAPPRHRPVRDRPLPPHRGPDRRRRPSPTPTASITAYDAVRTRIAVDSPIDLSKITWVEAANLCFLSGGTCDASKTKVSPHMDIDTYPLTTLAAPATAWTSTLGRTVTPTADRHARRRQPRR